jgi:hypothetical protein
MSKLSHPSMGPVRETTASQNKPATQTYVVGDETTPAGPPAPTIDDRLAQFSAPTQPEPSGVEYPMPEKKPISKALEKLIFIGRLSEEVEIADIKFEISSLTNKEHNEIIKMMYSFSEPADLFTIRIITLANSLKKIDGVPLDEIDIDGNFESLFHKRISIVDHLQLLVVEELYTAYEKLVGKEEEAGKQDEEIKN